MLCARLLAAQKLKGTGHVPTDDPDGNECRPVPNRGQPIDRPREREGLPDDRDRREIAKTPTQNNDKHIETSNLRLIPSKIQTSAAEGYYWAIRRTRVPSTGKTPTPHFYPGTGLSKQECKMPLTTTKQYALVTGASSGIGYELAKQFAQNGFDLLIVSAGDGIHSAARDFEALGANVDVVQADLAVHDGVHALVSRIESNGRPLDAAAINAGVGVSGRFVETDLGAELNMIRLNVLSTVHLAKPIVRQMVNQGSGRILFTASIAGTMPTPYEAVYGATKAFVRSFSQSLREELKESGVSVTALMPGATETNFFHRAGADDTKLGQSEKDDAAEVAKEGFEALMAGKDHVVAGSFKNKLEAAAGYALPDPLVAKGHAAAAAPGSGKKDN